MGGSQSVARQLPAATEKVGRALATVDNAALELARARSPAAVGKFNDMVAVSGRGSYVYDSADRKYLDVASGIGVTSTGHSHPAVVKAISDQAGALLFAQQNCTPMHQPLIDLTGRLADVLPANLDQYLFFSSGSEAVDNAVKIARNATGRPNIITFDGAFHGRTVCAMSLTASKAIYKQGMHPFMPSAVFTPYPYCLHCPTRKAAGGSGYTLEPDIAPFEAASGGGFQCCNSPLESLRWLLKMQSAPGDTAAIIVEPIQGEGGFLTPPPGFLPALRALCDEHGILLILDEVQSGAGRSGKWWAHEHFGSVRADILIFAKGIASGFPFAGLGVERRHLAKMLPGMLGGTYGGHIVGCAAATATIDIIRDEGLLDNAQARGLQLMRGLVALASRYPIIDVRGRGLMVAAELGEAGSAAKLCKAAFAREMIMISAGARDTLRFLPPLTVSEGEITECLAKLEGSFEDVFGKRS